MEPQLKEVSFEEMKSEFLVMDQEIKERTAEVDQLKRTLRIAEEKLTEREDASAKMIDQMEELHENLAELDARFERSEKHITQLQEEKEDLRKEKETEITDLNETVVNTQTELNAAKENLFTITNEYKEYQKETNVKIEQLRNTFKNSVDGAARPIACYIDKNKGSKTLMKKTKGYRLLKAVNIDLKNILSNTTNNNASS